MMTTGRGPTGAGLTELLVSAALVGLLAAISAPTLHNYVTGGTLEAGAKERDYRLVLEASTALNQTCVSCHTAHRVRTEDGTYEIKIK